MVTHDANVAAHAGRTLYMRDGEIVNGEQAHVAV
jgi:ABC-type lipoprotein export system ATPase subunit